MSSSYNKCLRCECEIRNVYATCSPCHGVLASKFDVFGAEVAESAHQMVHEMDGMVCRYVNAGDSS